MAEPAVKKFLGEDASETSTVEAISIGKPRSSFISIDWESIFQMCAIKVLDLGGKKSAQIYGTITLHHKWGKWKLYDCRKGKAETITVPGDMALTHPIFGIQPFDPVLITFELENEFEEANEVTLAWMPLNPRDQIKTYTLTGEACSMQVSFIAFRRAVLADINIYLILNNNNNIDDEVVEIYGSIYASFSETHSSLPFFMFEKKKVTDSVLVTMGESVPLLRPCIAVPDENDLQIHVALNTISGVSVARGIIRICRPDRGTWEGVLGNDHGQILRVAAKVHFSDLEEHEPTIKLSEDWV